MRRRRTMSAVLAALLLAAAAAAGDDARGTAAALRAHDWRDLQGAVAALPGGADDVLVVNFWASWCAPCRHELPRLDAWHAAWRGRGAQVVAVSIDRDADRAAAFVARAGLSLPVLHDGPDGLARRLDLPAVPTTYVVAPDGTLALTVSDGSDASLAEVQRTVERLLAARDGKARS